MAPPRLTVAMVALGVTIGQLVTAVPMLLVLGRIRGRSALKGVGRAAFASVVAGVAAGDVGLLVSVALPTSRTLSDLGTGALAAVVAVLVFGVVAYALDRGDLRMVAGRVRRFIRPRA
jgi:putative peptidoglycan lipid II flippase